MIFKSTYFLRKWPE